MADNPAIYTRISADKQGRALGVARQREDCEALARRLGYSRWTVYEDNDISASKGKLRERYEAMLAAVERGEHAALITWHPDRLTRRATELERLMTVIEAARIPVHTVTAGDYDLATPTGRQVARIIGATAQAEAERISEKVRRKHDELRAAGAWSGGGRRAYGWTLGRREVIPEERAIVQEAARRVLDGETLGAIARDLGQRDVSTVSQQTAVAAEGSGAGSPWTTKTLRQLLLSPAAAGLRDGRDAVWEALIDRATHERLVRVLRDPERRKGGRPREYLLTGGLAVCGRTECGAPLVARSNERNERGYVCAGERYASYRGCGKIRVLAAPLEDLVRDALVLRLASPAVLQALNADESGDEALALAEVSAVEDALQELDQDYYELRRMPRARYLDASARLEARAQAARDTLALRKKTTILSDLPRSEGALLDEWEARDGMWRRALASTIIDRVPVSSAVKGRNRFDPNRVDIRWRA